MWPRFLVLLIGCQLLGLTGCGGSDSLSQSAAPQVQEVAPQEISSLKVTLQLDLPATTDSQKSSFPPSASSFVLEVIDPETSSTLAGPASLDRVAGQSSLVQSFEALSRGEVRLQVTALDASGARLGLADLAVALDGPLIEVTVSSLFLPGLTREIGRVSINQENANGASTQPAISSDGRVVAFRSAATNLIPTLQQTPGARIYRKDRISGVVTRTSSGSADASPDLSGDGRMVVYQTDPNPLRSQILLRDTSSGRGSRTVTPTTVALGSGTLSIAGGSEPRISEDGNTAVYITRSLSSDAQVALVDRPSGVSTLLTQTASGQTAGACSHPSMTPDALQIFFSTVGLAQGPAGLVVVDRSTGQATQLLASPSDFPCAVSRNGSLVAVHDRDHRLLLINRATATTTEIPRANTFAAVGAPSLSADGRFLTFSSGRSDLVSNDQNGQVDLFVLDRSTAVISRINVSNDQSVVTGGLIATLAEGPVVSRDGTRIAFASNDASLVPLDRNQFTDVFSAINPTPGKLYVASGSAILRFDNITTARGLLATPAATITSPDLGPFTSDMFLDVANDRLYVVSGPLSRDRVLVFERASTLNGQVAPSQVSTALVDGASTGLAVDVETDQIYCGRNRSNEASRLTLNGLISFFSEPVSAVILSTRQGLALGVSGSTLNIFDVTGGRQVQLLGGRVRAMALDVSGRGQLFALAESGNGIGSHSLIRYTGSIDSGFFEGPGRVLPFTPLQVISGVNTLLGPPPPAPTLGPLVVDSFSGDLYASSGVRINVFPASADGDIAPGRIIRISAEILAMALDRTR